MADKKEEQEIEAIKEMFSEGIDVDSEETGLTEEEEQFVTSVQHNFRERSGNPTFADPLSEEAFQDQSGGDVPTDRGGGGTRGQHRGQQQRRSQDLEERFKKLNQREKRFREKVRKFNQELQKDRPQTLEDSIDAFIENRNPRIHTGGNDFIRPDDPKEFAEALQDSPDPKERQFGQRLELKLLQDQINAPKQRAQQDRKRFQKLRDLALSRLQNVRKRKQQFRQNLSERQQQAFENRMDVQEFKLDRQKEKRLSRKQRGKEQVARRDQFLQEVKRLGLTRDEEGNVRLAGLGELAKKFGISQKEARSIEVGELERRRRERQGGGGAGGGRRGAFSAVNFQTGAEVIQRSTKEDMTDTIRKIVDRTGRDNIENIEKEQGQVRGIQITEEGPALDRRDLSKAGAVVKKLQKEGFDKDTAIDLVSQQLRNNVGLQQDLARQETKQVFENIINSRQVEEVDKLLEKKLDTIDRKSTQLDNSLNKKSVKRLTSPGTEKLFTEESPFEEANRKMVTRVQNLIENNQAQFSFEDLKKGSDQKKAVNTLQNVAGSLRDQISERVEKFKKQKRQAEGQGAVSRFFENLFSKETKVDLVFSAPVGGGGAGAKALYRTMMEGDPQNASEQEKKAFLDKLVSFMEGQERIYNLVATGGGEGSVTNVLSSTQEEALEDLYGKGSIADQVLSPVRMKVMQKTLLRGGPLGDQAFERAISLADEVPGLSSFNGRSIDGDPETHTIRKKNRAEYRPTRITQEKFETKEGERVMMPVYDALVNANSQIDGITGGNLAVAMNQVQQQGKDLDKQILSDSDYLNAKKFVTTNLFQVYNALQDHYFGGQPIDQSSLPRGLKNQLTEFIRNTQRSEEGLKKVNRALTDIETTLRKEVDNLMVSLKDMTNKTPKQIEDLRDNLDQFRADLGIDR